MSKAVFTICEVHHNHDGEFVDTDAIDPDTLENKRRAVTKKLQAQIVHDLPEDLAAELVQCGAARLPTEAELQIHRLAKGPAQ